MNPIDTDSLASVIAEHYKARQRMAAEASTDEYRNLHKGACRALAELAETIGRRLLPSQQNVPFLRACGILSPEPPKYATHYKATTHHPDGPDSVVLDFKEAQADGQSRVWHPGLSPADAKALCEIWTRRGRYGGEQLYTYEVVEP